MNPYQVINCNDKANPRNLSQPSKLNKKTQSVSNFNNVVKIHISRGLSLSYVKIYIVASTYYHQIHHYHMHT